MSKDNKYFVVIYDDEDGAGIAINIVKAQELDYLQHEEPSYRIKAKISLTELIGPRYGGEIITKFLDFAGAFCHGRDNPLIAELFKVRDILAAGQPLHSYPPHLEKALGLAAVFNGRAETERAVSALARLMDKWLTEKSEKLP